VDDVDDEDDEVPFFTALRCSGILVCLCFFGGAALPLALLALMAAGIVIGSGLLQIAKERDRSNEGVVCILCSVLQWLCWMSNLLPASIHLVGAGLSAEREAEQSILADLERELPPEVWESSQ